MRLLAALAVLLVLLTADDATAIVTPGNGTTDNGCSLYVAVPNPCDPDSFN